MYRRSFSELQTDYLDYYLLHSIGGGQGMKTFNDRYVDNGMLDFLMKEREAGAYPPSGLVVSRNVGRFR